MLFLALAAAGFLNNLSGSGQSGNLLLVAGLIVYWLASIVSLRRQAFAHGGWLLAWPVDTLLCGTVYGLVSSAAIPGGGRWPQRWRRFLHRLVVARDFERALWPAFASAAIGIVVAAFATQPVASLGAGLVAFVILVRVLHRWYKARVASSEPLWEAREELLKLIEGQEHGQEWRGTWRGHAVFLQWHTGPSPRYWWRIRLPVAPFGWTLHRDHGLTADPEWIERLARSPVPALLGHRPALSRLVSHPSRGEVEAAFLGQFGVACEFRADLDALIDACTALAAAEVGPEPA